MNDLFLGIFLTSIIGLIVGLIKPSLIMSKGRLLTSILFSVTTIFSFLSFGITLNDNSNPSLGLLSFAIVPIIITVRLYKKMYDNKPIYNKNNSKTCNNETANHQNLHSEDREEKNKFDIIEHEKKLPSSNLKHKVTSTNRPLQSKSDFSYWDKNIHLDVKQLDRIKRAKLSATTPSQISIKDRNGIFKGSGKSDYVTTLVSCSCMDFITRRLPCKHIYRLALELNFIEGNFENGRNKNSLDDDINNLSIEAQELFLELLYFYIHRGSNKLLLCRNSITEELFKKGFFIEDMQNYTSTIEHMDLPFLKNELFSIEDTSLLPKKTSHRKTFSKWIDEKEKSDIKFLWDNFIVLEITEDTNKLKHKIYYYLNKKFKEYS